jgi:hypothetical protein
MFISSEELIDRVYELIDSLENEKSALNLEKRVVSNYTQNLIIIDEQLAKLEGQITALETVLDLLPECEERN